MDIKIEERTIGSVTVLDIVGRLTIDQGAQHLKDKINSLISQQRTQIVLNLKNVPYIDSGGLGQLVASYGSVMKTGGALKLLNVTARNHDLLSITRLVTVFESFDSEAEAIQSFQTLAPVASLHSRPCEGGGTPRRQQRATTRQLDDGSGTQLGPHQACPRDRLAGILGCGTTWFVHRFARASARMSWTWGDLAFRYASRS